EGGGERKANFFFPAVPGRFFKGKVAAVGAFIPQGQLQPSGNLVDPEQIKGEGRILVAIEPEEDLSKYLIVPGSTAQVAVYTHHMHHLAILRKVLLRMKSWTNFLFSAGPWPLNGVQRTADPDRMLSKLLIACLTFVILIRT